MGTTEQNKFTVFIELPTGTKLDVTNSIVKKVEALAKEIREMKIISSRVEPWSSKVYVELKSYPHFFRARFVCDYILIELQRLSALIALIIIGCEISRIEGVEIAAPQPDSERELRAVDRSDPA